MLIIQLVRTLATSTCFKMRKIICPHYWLSYSRDSNMLAIQVLTIEPVCCSVRIRKLMVFICVTSLVSVNLFVMYNYWKSCALNVIRVNKEGNFYEYCSALKFMRFNCTNFWWNWNLRIARGARSPNSWKIKFCVNFNSKALRVD